MPKKKSKVKVNKIPPPTQVNYDQVGETCQQPFNPCKQVIPSPPEPNALDEVKSAFYRYQQAKANVADVERMLNGAKDAMAVTEREYKARAKSLLEEIHESLRK